MADLVGMNLATVDRYVRGDRTPPHDFLMAIAERYNVSLDWLYGREGSGTLDESQQAEPAWARRLDARMRFLERRVKEIADQLSRPGSPPDYATLVRLVLDAVGGDGAPGTGAVHQAPGRSATRPAKGAARAGAER